MIEDSLREMFSQRAESPRPSAGVASTVIDRARAVRRRRAAGTSIAAVLALALTIGGALSARGWWAPDGGSRGTAAIGSGYRLPTDPPSPDPAVSASDGASSRAARTASTDLDLLVGGQLWTADGRRLTLGGAGVVTSAYRVPVGWVYGGVDRVRLMRPDGTAVDLGPATAWVVSPDGHKLAYRRDRTLGVARLTPGGLVTLGAVVAPADVAPVAFIADRVAVASADGASHDHWTPGDQFRPTWNRKVAAVYGGSVREAVGLVRAGTALCVGALAAQEKGLQVGDTGACALGLLTAGGKRAGTSPAAAEGVLGPDGRWLAAPVAKGYALVDVRAATSGGAAAVVCPVVGSITWLDAATVVGRGATGAVTCGVDGVVRPYELPPGLGIEWDFVPSLPVPGR